MRQRAGPGFFDSIGICFSKYAQFSGRASRGEYWWFGLFQFLIFAAMFAMLLPHWVHDIGVAEVTGKMPPQDTAEAVINGVYDLLSLAMFLPALGVAVRRLHDCGKSGWWWFLGLVPLAGPLILLVWFCRHGMAGPNRYGPDPLGGP